MDLIPRWFFMSGEVPRYEGAYARLEKLFQRGSDPWGFDKDRYETARFERILEAVRRVPHSSILEVGCAEGHITRRLCGISKDVVAIDVSETAVLRARAAAPRAEVLRMTLEEASFERRFDLVLCAETLYYLKDIPGAIAKLSSLGEFVLVTYTLYEKHRLDPFFRALPTLAMEPFDYLRFFDGGRLVNWRGIRLVLWWSGALKAAAT